VINWFITLSRERIYIISSPRSFDLPVARDMDGNMFTEVFDKKILDERLIRYIKSCEEEGRIKRGPRDKKLDEKTL